MKRRTSPHYAWVVIWMACVVVFAALGLARFGYSIVLPSMQHGLQMNNTQAGVLATSDLIAYLLLSVIGGALASRFGPRRVITAGLVCAGAGMVLTGLARNVMEAIVARVIVGAGSGASNVPVMGMLAAWTTKQKRGLAAGLAVSGSSLGLMCLGPSVPPLIRAVGPNGWRVVWISFGAIAGVIALLAGLLLRDKPADIGLVPLGTDANPEGRSRTLPGGTPASASVNGTSDRAWQAIMRIRGAWSLGLVYTAFGFSYIIYMTFFVKRLVADAGYTHSEAGRLFMSMGVCSVVCGVLWGSVSDRLGRACALMLIYLVHTVSFVLYGMSIHPVGLTVSAILFGLSAWSIPAVMAAACGDMAGPRLAPAMLGFITLFFGVGQATGPSVAGVLTDRTGSLSAALLLAAAAALAGAVGSFCILCVQRRLPAVPSAPAAP